LGQHTQTDLDKSLKKRFVSTQKRFVTRVYTCNHRPALSLSSTDYISNILHILWHPGKLQPPGTV